MNLKAGHNFVTKLGSDGSPTFWTVITALGAAGSTTSADLQGMNGTLSGNYVLGANIDASTTSSWNSGKGFTPIGTSSSAAFTGKLDGLGHTISHLTINDLISSTGKGLFGIVNNATIRNLVLDNFRISMNATAGTLAGYTQSTAISNVHVSNTLISGTFLASGSNNIGGLIGYARSGTNITQSYVSSTVSINTPYYPVAGGLVGNNAGTINQCYSLATVKGNINVGGLVGQSSSTGNITNSYSGGSVSGGSNDGGFVGVNSGSISNSYTNATVTGTNHQGAFVGVSNGTNNITNSFWNTSTSSLPGVALYNTGSSQSSLTGITATEMQNPLTFMDAGWDFNNIWGKSKTGNNSNLMVLKTLDSTTYPYSYYTSLRNTGSTTPAKSTQKWPNIYPDNYQHKTDLQENLANLAANAPAPEQRINQLAGTESLNNLANNHLWNDQRQHQTIVSISGKTWSVNFMQVGHQVMLMNPQNEPFSSADLPDVLEQSNYQDTDHAKKVVFQLTDKTGKPINVITHITSDGKAIIDVSTQLGNTFKKEELSLISLEALKQLGVDVSKISQIILNKVVI